MDIIGLATSGPYPKRLNHHLISFHIIRALMIDSLTCNSQILLDVAGIFISKKALMLR